MESEIPRYCVSLYFATRLQGMSISEYWRTGVRLLNIYFDLLIRLRNGITCKAPLPLPTLHYGQCSLSDHTPSYPFTGLEIWRYHPWSRQSMLYSFQRFYTNKYIRPMQQYNISLASTHGIFLEKVARRMRFDGPL